MDQREVGVIQHPGERRFMQCRLSREETRKVLLHLLTGCPQCLQVTRRLWQFGEEARLKIPAEGALSKAKGVPASPETQS